MCARACVETMYNIRIPGFSLDEVRQVRKQTMPISHQQRLSQVKRAMAVDSTERKERHLIPGSTSAQAGASEAAAAAAQAGSGVAGPSGASSGQRGANTGSGSVL